MATKKELQLQKQVRAAHYLALDGAVVENDLDNSVFIMEAKRKAIRMIVRSDNKAEKAAKSEEKAIAQKASNLRLTVSEVYALQGKTGQGANQIKAAVRHAAERLELEKSGLVDVIENKPVTLKIVELCPGVEQDAIGQHTTYTEVQPGTVTDKIRNGGGRYVREWSISKYCLAQYVDGLAKNVIVISISKTNLKGKEIDADQVQNIIWKYTAKTGRALLWTQSSIKGGSGYMFYTVTKPMFEKLTKRFNLDEGQVAANTLGLLFSDIDSRPLFAFKRNVVPGSDEHDGNITCDPALTGGFACQFRGVALEIVNGQWEIVALAKGTLTPVKGAGLPAMDTNTVKFMAVGLNHAYSWVIGTQENVSARRVGHGYASAEPLVFLKDSENVRSMFVSMTYREVSELIGLFSPEHRAELSDRLGGIAFEDYELMASKQVVVELLNAKIDWCSVIENAMGRFIVDLLCKVIAPSGGVRVSQSLLQGWEGADEAVDRKDESITRAAFGMPVCKPGDVMFFTKSPMVLNKGLVIRGSDARKAKRDFDGDYGRIMQGRTETETRSISAVFASAIDMNITGHEIPGKNKRPMPVTPEAFTDLAMRIIASGGIVGAATIAQWKFLQAAQIYRWAWTNGGTEEHHQLYLKYAKLAGDMGFAAQTAPMLAKHHIVIDQMEFTVWFRKLYGQHSKWLKSQKLQWHDMAKKSHEWKSPRDICDQRIENPQCLLDHTWNAMVTAVTEWSDKHVIEEVPTGQIQSLIFQSRGDIPTWALIEAREIQSNWASYWADTAEDNRSVESDREIRKETKAAIKSAKPEVIDALLTTRARNAEVIVKLVASCGRLIEAVGLHPDIKEYIAMHPKYGKVQMEGDAARLIAALGFKL